MIARYFHAFAALQPICFYDKAITATITTIATTIAIFTFIFITIQCLDKIIQAILCRKDFEYWVSWNLVFGQQVSGKRFRRLQLRKNFLWANTLYINLF